LSLAALWAIVLPGGFSRALSGAAHGDSFKQCDEPATHGPGLSQLDNPRPAGAIQSFEYPIDALLLPEAMMKQQFSLMLGVVSVVSLVVALGVGQQAAAQSSGKQDYYYVCFKCHETGVMAAPKVGDPSAWKSIIKQGKQILYQHAINGFGAMPVRAGSSLSDSQIKAGVDYMLAQVSHGGGGGGGDHGRAR